MVDMGVYIMDCGTKYHFTHVNPKFCADADGIVEQALRIINLFADKHNVGPDRVVVSVRESARPARFQAVTYSVDSG